MSKKGGGYQQKFQRLPKRPEVPPKPAKYTPGSPTQEEEDYNLNEHASYQQTEPGYSDPGTVWTAPPEVYTMNVGAPIRDQINFAEGEGAGEFVQVACRIRPMLQFEVARGDDYCIKVINDQDLQLNKGAGVKSFRFNRVIDEKASQSDVFHQCNCSKLINSALEGYSATLFAYGQTGSGKTFT